jgi:hypothetical protein
MPDPQLVEALYARQTLAEVTAGLKTQSDLPVDSDLGKLVQAQLLLEQGKQAEAQDGLIGLIQSTQDSRVLLWTSKALRDLGLWPGGPMAQEAQGVVFEVPTQGSTDVLAVYRDTTVRFFSYSGKMAFYEPSAQVQAIHQSCQHLMSAADKIIETPRAKPPQYIVGSPRITILTIRGEILVDTEDVNALLMLGAPIINVLTNLQQQ